MRFRFLRTISLITLLLGVVLYFPLTQWAEPDVAKAIVASGIAALVNALIGFFILEYVIDKPNSPFMIGVFGGMGLRMGLILIEFFVLLTNGYHALALSLSLMGFHIIFMIAEIVYVIKELGKQSARTKQKKTAGNTHLMRRTLLIDQAKN